MRYTLMENRPSEALPLTEADLRYLQDFKFARDLLIVPSRIEKTYQVTADNIVGVISLPSGTQINIRPKIGLPNLFRLLSFVSDWCFCLDEMADYEEEEGIFDLLGQLYSRELTTLIKNGLKQDYDSSEGNMTTIRGRILFGTHLKHNLTQTGKAYCLFSERSSNTVENQILLAATQALLRGQVCNVNTQKALRACLKNIPAQVDIAGFSSHKLTTIQIGRHNQCYRRPLFLATLILRSIGFINEFGPSRQPSFLINSAKLFEDYVALALEKYYLDPVLEVIAQEISPFDTDGTLNIKPDLVFRQKGVGYVVSVADTKYKDLDLRNVNSADAYQMLAYMVNLNCQVSVLIYPESIFRSAGQKETVTIPSVRGDYQIYVITVPLADPKDTAAAIKKTIQAIQGKFPNQLEDVS
ncbi:MAG: hypothetical protein HY537_02005 [Deltaproteobacteria bacterium]|nr:hypothetical protein [Deltaproteobacteria bacterium]